MMLLCISFLTVAFSCISLRPCVCTRRQFEVLDPESPRDMCGQYVQCGGAGQPCCADGCTFGSICTNMGCQRCGGYDQLCCPDDGASVAGATVRDLCPYAGMHWSWRDVQVTASCINYDWSCYPNSGRYPELQLWSHKHLDLSHSKLNHHVTLAALFVSPH
jgi:hypothetical protein